MQETAKRNIARHPAKLSNILAVTFFCLFVHTGTLQLPVLSFLT